MTPTRVGLHALAHELHMTVGRMTSEMSLREYMDWMLYFEHINKRDKQPEKVQFDWSDPTAVHAAFDGRMQ
jgi:hypothetical protein